ncbi:MAG: hypothetical protein COB20_06025 [SAR86 cluster bacterium]|uniref:Metallo-beta-lactamase domain-containing protein n=1 Tax=SAR86 cluster bacterium TaxID=2030880 RepID=A0A2A4X8S0_9GAMM|nr:MAG: hypothetical protein COB20_06025 [SAR86 cluster bacterium]
MHRLTEALMEQIYNFGTLFRKLTVLLCASTLVVGCSANPLHPLLLADKEHVKLENSSLILESPNHTENISVKLHYLGVGGLMIEVEGKRLLTAPFYSNPSFWRNIPGISLARNSKRISNLFPGHLRDAQTNPENRVGTIIAGHSHYDHLLDVPFIMENYLHEARFVGSETAVAIISDQLGFDCNLNGSRTIAAKESQWMDMGDGIFIYSIPTTHAPHFWSFTAQTGKYKCGKPLNIRTAWDWKMGDVYAYLIDFRDDEGNVLLRAYYQDTASDPGKGKVPDEMISQRGIDVAVIVMAGFSKAGDYPRSVIENTRATLTVVGHWEDFFHKLSNPFRVSPGSNQLEYVGRLEASLSENQSWVMTMPGNILQLEFRTIPGAQKD